MTNAIRKTLARRILRRSVQIVGKTALLAASMGMLASAGCAAGGDIPETGSNDLTFAEFEAAAFIEPDTGIYESR